MPRDDKTRMTLTIDKKLKHQVTLLAAEERRDISDQICVMLIAQMPKDKVRAKA